ncbi:phage tail length tape measure family protein [Teichococcus aestuarii]|uniref:phage tail length tape measure family protein n=2 Tax=Teichococcus aestuarii TaxID=568898 RepID=UPI0036107B78
MATVAQVTEAVYRARYEDQVTAAANAASRALKENTAAVVSNEQAVTRASKSASQLANQYDPVTRATRQLERAQRDLAAAQTTLASSVAVNGAGQEQAARTLAGLQQRVARAEADVVAAKRAFGGLDEATVKLGHSSRITAQQMSQLTPQLNDIFTSIAGGMPAMMILTQQGPQITQVFGGVRATMAAVAATVGTTTIAVAGLTASIGALIVVSEGAERRLDRLADRLRATRTDYDRMAQVATEAGLNGIGSTLSREDRTDVARILAGPRQFGGSSQDLVLLTRTAEDLARVMGTDAAEAASKLAKAMRDPAAVAKELNEEQFPGMERSLLRQIERLQRTGDRAGAFARVLEAVRRQTEGAAGPSTELGRAWERLTEALTPAWNAAKSLAETLGGALARALAWIIDKVANLIEKLNELVRLTRNSAVGRFFGLEAAEVVAQPSVLSPGAIRNVPGERSGLNQNSPDAANDNIRALQQQADLMRFAAGAARELAQAEAALKEATRADGGASSAQIAAARAAVQSRLNGELTDYLVTLGQQAEAEQVAADTMSGTAAATQEAINQNRALVEALKYGTAGSREYEIAVNRIKAALDQLAGSEQARREATALRDQRDQLEILEAEGRLVGVTADQRERELAAIKERQRIVNEGGKLDSEASRQRLDNVQRTFDLEARNTQLRNSMDELARVGEQAFDRIGSAITEAFAQGSAKAINFGSIAKAVLSEIVQYALRMAVLNPALNALFGGGRATASSTAAALSGAGSSGGASSMLSMASTGSSLWNAFGSGSISSGLDAWGASNLGFLGFSGGSTPVSTAAGLAGADPNAVAGLTQATTTTMAAPAAGLWNGGSALGGFSSFSNVLGIAGAALPGLMSGNYAQAGLGVGGAALGTMILPGVGTIVGGLAGNLLGGMFGQDPARPASSVQIGIDESGQLVVLGSRAKGMSASEGIAATQQSLGGVNAALATRGLSLRGTGGMAVAQTHQGSDADLAAADQAELTRVVLSSITGGSEAVMQVIAGEIAKGAAASLDQAFADVDWVKSVYEPLSSTTPVVSAFQQQIDALNTTYAAATAKAQELGTAVEGLASRRLRPSPT